MDKSIPDFLRRNRTPLDSSNSVRRRMSSKTLLASNAERKSLQDNPEFADFDSPPIKHIPNTGRSLYEGMQPKEIAEKCVPKSRDEQFEMMAEMFSLSSSPAKIEGAIKDKFDKWASDSINQVDFSSKTREKLISLVSAAMSESPQFHKAVQKYGMPSLVVRSKESEKALMNRGFIKEHLEASSDAPKLGSFAHSIFDPFANEISFSPDALNETTTSVQGDSPVQVDDSFSGYLRHEWGHYLHMSILNDIERSVGIFSSRKKSKSRLLDIAEKYCSQTPMMKIIDKAFGDTPNTPRAVSQLSHESMLEMFAEGVSAYLHPDGDVGRKSINSVLRKDVSDALDIEEDQV